ncbi:hypothetical protein CHU95_03500 [Niveispirillum lacus]|uniref:S1 motif domain-containing protein n=1 Tax=Niveispirillum lacus TaxID=1981099 RepID=A0A255Z5W2_9PROT|nr:hypothetical protein [Niveispirillum lacus]OYQ36846.1 hypothetical protein CHU95_03500 [Niveispirillum lacus]
MGILDIFRLFFLNGPPSVVPTAEMPITDRGNDLEVGDLVTGSISYVGPKFYKVQISHGRIGHVGGYHIPREKADVSSYYQRGDRLQVVVLGPSRSKPGEYTCSETLVEEMIRRVDLSTLSVGDEVEVRVTRPAEDKTDVSYGKAKGFVPHARFTGGPERKYALIAGQVIKVRVDWIDVPELEDSLPPSKLHSSFAASLCLVPAQPLQTVPWDVGAVACRMHVDVRLPRKVDVICQWCLERLADGADCAALVAETGLPSDSVHAIAHLLAEHGLVKPKSWIPTARGKSLLTALAKAADAKRHPVRFLFASAMPTNARFLPAATEPAERVPGSVEALQDKVQELRLRADTSSALSGLYTALPDACPETTREALSDQWLRVSLQVGHHAIPVTLSVPKAFLTEGLYRHFTTAEREPPERVPHCREYARVVLLVRLKVTLETPKDAVPERQDEEIYLEPASGTLWHSDPERNTRMQCITGDILPVLPLDFARRLAFIGRLIEVQPLGWNKAILHGTRGTSIPVENGRDHGQGWGRDGGENARPGRPPGTAGGSVGRSRRDSGRAGLQRHEGEDRRGARGDRAVGATVSSGTRNSEENGGANTT